MAAESERARARESGAERRVAIVTGGSRGIGKAIVEQLARAGLEVHFSYVQSEAPANALVEALRAEGAAVHAVRVNARDRVASGELSAQVIRQHGRLDVLVNNAAITSDKPLPMMSDDDWTSVLETSLNGLYGATKPAARQMMRARSGRIINMTSVSGLVGIPGQTNYSAAKAAIIGFTRSLAKELATWNVPVNAVAPGFTDTDMVASQTPEQRAAALARVPMRRFASADEVATLVRFLALEAPTFMTGQTLVIDGGMIG
jgi:3-oxoacyl-[acyl-carrier protein] reductase